MHAPDEHASTWWFPRFWAIGIVLLCTVTYPLWWVSRHDLIPPVPLLQSTTFQRWDAGSIGLLNAATILLIAACLAIAIQSRMHRFLWGTVFLSLAISFAFDQHRLQPWAYQSALFALLLASMPAALARRWMALLAASIYIYSAAGKFDFQFAHTVGQDFLAILAKIVGGLPDGLPESTKAALTLAFPSFELLVGIGVLVPATRRIAGYLAMVIHVTLIGVLGPFGLNHSTGVLLWNALLIVQSYALFVQHDPIVTSTQTKGSWFRWPARCAICIALIAPLTERFGYWDHWLSWSLYSPHTSRVEVELHQTVIGQLDECFADYLQPDLDGDQWRRLDLAKLSLESRRVPVYPQARYQLSVALEIARRYGITDGIRARLRGIADRWDGHRGEKRLIGRQQLQQAADTFWFPWKLL